MKAAAISEPSPLRGPSAFSALKAARDVVARAVADAWLNLLFWFARKHPAFVARSKPLWVWGAWEFSPWFRGNLTANMRRVLPAGASAERVRQTAKATLSSFYDFVADVGASVGCTREQLLARVHSVEGDENYRAGRAEGRGAIIVTAHMGSFEVATAALLRHETRIHVLFRRDAKGLFDRTRSALRKQLGVCELPVEDGLVSWIQARDALLRNEAVLVQGDRVTDGQKGQRVAFLGGHVALPTGPIKLARVTGAALIPVFAIRLTDGRVKLSVEKPIDAANPDAALRQWVCILEKYVRAYPQQWLMVHRAFCEDSKP